MLLVPVLILAHAYSGNEHHVALGDELSVVLVYRPTDLYVPPHLLVHLQPDLVPAKGGGTIIHEGGLTAWSPQHHPTSEPFRRGAWFADDLDADAPDSLPPTIGSVHALEHVSVLVLPTGMRAPLVGLHPIPNTDETPASLTIYATTSDQSPRNGDWSHFGWLATIAVVDRV